MGINQFMYAGVLAQPATINPGDQGELSGNIVVEFKHAAGTEWEKDIQISFRVFGQNAALAQKAEVGNKVMISGRLDGSAKETDDGRTFWNSWPVASFVMFYIPGVTVNAPAPAQAQSQAPAQAPAQATAPAPAATPPAQAPATPPATTTPPAQAQAPVAPNSPAPVF